MAQAAEAAEKAKLQKSLEEKEKQKAKEANITVPAIPPIPSIPAPFTAPLSTTTHTPLLVLPAPTHTPRVIGGLPKEVEGCTSVAALTEYEGYLAKRTELHVSEGKIDTWFRVQFYLFTGLGRYWLSPWILIQPRRSLDGQQRKESLQH